MRKTKHALFRHAKLGSRRLIVPMSQKVATMYSERALPLLGTWGCNYSPRLVNRMLGFSRLPCSLITSVDFDRFSNPRWRSHLGHRQRGRFAQREYGGVGLMSHLHPAKYRAIDLLLMELN